MPAAMFFLWQFAASNARQIDHHLGLVFLCIAADEFLESETLNIDRTYSFMLSLVDTGCFHHSEALGALDMDPSYKKFYSSLGGRG